MTITIYIHRSSDIDSLLALAALRFYKRELRIAKIIFVEANWNGPMKEGDLAIDIFAGGRGMKGSVDEDGMQHSAFELVVRTFAPESELLIVGPLIVLIDAHDTFGDPFLYLYGPEMDLELRMSLNEFCILMFYRALRSTGKETSMEKNDRKLLRVFDDFFEGFRLNRIATLQGKSALMPGILTLDQGFAISAYCQENKVPRSAQAVFKNNDWTGRLSDGSVVIADVDDLNAGSYLAQVMENSSEKEQELMKSLVLLMNDYVICQRNPFEHLLKDTVYAKDHAMLEFLFSISIIEAFDALRRAVKLRGEKKRKSLNQQLAGVAQRIFKAFRYNRLRFLEVHEMVRLKDPRFTFMKGGEVVVVNNVWNHRVTDVLSNYYGVRVFVGINGNNLGIRRADGETVRMDHPAILKVIWKAGELEELENAASYCRTSKNGKNGEWFLHSSGFLVANGTKGKSPAKQPSSIDPLNLAKAALVALAT